MVFHEQMKDIERKLHELGFNTYVPELGGNEDFSKMTVEQIRQIKGQHKSKHREEISSSDAILVTNYEKKGIPNYVGPSALAEIGMAYALQKKIFLLFDIPATENRIELLGMGIISLNGKLERLQTNV